MDNATDLGAAVPDMGLAGLKMAGALFFLLALIFLGFYLIRRFNLFPALKRPGTDQLQFLGQLSLGAKRNLVMVRFLNKILVLGVTDSSITKISEVPVDESTTTDQSFSTILDKQSQEDSVS